MLQRFSGSARYHLFILTVWAEDHSPQEPVRWRYSLEESHTGVRNGFKDLAELLAYLTEWTQRPPVAVLPITPAKEEERR